MHWPAALVSRWTTFWRPKPLGHLGERAAERYLKRKGYKMVARGLRMRGAELDLVAVDGRTVVFVEVKTRRTQRAGHPAEVIDERKQRHMTRGALFFLKRHGLLENQSRFDVVALIWPHQAQKPQIEHFVNAFTATGFDGMFS